MDAAIRWSPHATAQNARFIIIDVAGKILQLNEVTDINKDKVAYRQVAITRAGLLNSLSAFDWSKTQERFVGIGTAAGEAKLVELDHNAPNAAIVLTFSIKRQRKCNSIAFSTKNFLATGLDGVRNDPCMNVYDLDAHGSEPYRRLASSEAIASIKFFPGSPDTLVSGVARQCLRLYDLRDSPSTSTVQFPTRQVHNISIDPLDENYFISAGPQGDTTVSVWDKRWASRSTPGTPSGEYSTGPVLEIRNAVADSTDAVKPTTIWSLRHSGKKRGCFGILASTGEIKIFELAQHSINTQNSLHANPINHQGGATWGTNYYAKRSHILQYPIHDESSSPVKHSTRAYAYDFMNVGSPGRGHAVATISTPKAPQGSEVTLLRVPEAPPYINFTATNELYSNATVVAKPRPRREKVAETLADIQNRVFNAQNGMSGSQRLGSSLQSSDTLSITLDGLNLTSSSSSSRAIHEDLLTLGYPDVKLDPEDLLTTLDVQKRRCQEGYSFDCQKNRPIVANDPWLVEMWDLIHRLDQLKDADGMVASGFDMSYFGVYSIWKNTLRRKPNVNRLHNVEPPNDIAFASAIRQIVQLKGLSMLGSDMEGSVTKYMAQRQLSLAICGWDLSKDELREHSIRLIEQGQSYKAIVLAVFQGHKDLALDLLRHATKYKYLQNIGLGAIIISSSAIDEETRSMCSWMIEDSQDPYLKALLTYFITGDWRAAADMPQLALIDRTGIALRYLDDASVNRFIESATASAISAGDIEGIVLTGLDQPAMDLFEKYMTHFGDIQTAVLAMGRTQPLYTIDQRWPLWYETYLWQMHSWHTFMERSRFIAQHNLRAINRRGRSLNPTPQPQVTIRCNICQLSLARHPPKTTPNSHSPGSASAKPSTPVPTMAAPPTSAETTNSIKQKHAQRSPAALSGTVCPRCGAPMPRCGICMMWLGSPDPTKPGGAAAVAEEDILARQMTLCLSCGHGFHGHHAKEWFRRHQMCPVPDCGCMCGLGGGGK